MGAHCASSGADQVVARRGRLTSIKPMSTPQLILSLNDVDVDVDNDNDKDDAEQVAVQRCRLTAC